ncbi:bifunctional 5,10-methylenetetrahydrofolate dehydrogenase/5,10-methenyltetrahydrofolate cyclohydrolase [Candidatus Parcubacteria bacterium]|nr:bifunctional 5,10-methylenetetrahydrofolate dehydrogenase/5,10-methenyltetrahydrofolate cyclohydrolase [Candidatus Parcubacteria bacterium]
MKILDGIKLARKINRETEAGIKKSKTALGLAVILIGNNPSSKLYVKLKKEQAEKIGIKFYKYKFSENVAQSKILKIINSLNKDEKISGIIVQLPLAKKFNTEKIIQAIDPNKDVDGFHKKNLRALTQKKPLVVSPLILSIIELLKKTDQNLSNKKIAIIANSSIFSNSLRAVLRRNKAKKDNLFLIKPENKNLIKKTLIADIIIIAIGKPKFLKANMIKKAVVVIDIGINKIGNKIVGDTDFENIKNKVSFITPVPGGIGPLTIAMLLKNCLELAKMQKKEKAGY